MASKGIETPRRCFNVLSVRSYQSFPYALGEDILSAECVDGDIKGPASGRRGGPIHKVNLSPALDPRSSGGRGRAPPLPSFGRKPWKLFSFSCSVVSCCPFSCGEGLFRGPQLGLFSERVFSKEVPSFLFLHRLPLGAAFSTPSQKAHTLSLMRRCQLRSQGVHRGGPLGPSSSQVLPGASPRCSWILHFFALGTGRRP